MVESSKNPVRRELSWAISPEKITREFFVQNLYPRLLYAFSDIIVFVVGNQRYAFSYPAIDSVGSLIYWGITKPADVTTRNNRS